MFKKLFSRLFFATVLLALLATVALPGANASADAVKFKGFAEVVKVSVVSVASTGVSVNLLGSITCDKMITGSAVRGKAMAIFAYDVKKVGSGVACGKSKNLKASVTIPGPLVAGIYTVYVNPNDEGTQWQKKFQIVVPVAVKVTPTPKP